MAGPKSPSSAGFTIIEMMAVIAIILVLLAIVVPAGQAFNARAVDRAEVQRALGELRRARSAVLTRAELAPGTLTRSSGIQVVSATQYLRFVDDDQTAGGEVTQSVVDLSETQLTIVLPLPGQQIRFRDNGTLLPTSPIALRLADGSGREFTIDVPLTGIAQLN